METANIDDPAVNDNRNYDYTSCPEDTRREYDVILGMIGTGSRIIDLGCGNGTLIRKLQRERSANVKGMEISPSGVDACRAKGLDVIRGHIDGKLPFGDNEFDYAVCNVTIQMVMYPELLLTEMKRIARYQIVSFPNFAFYRNRIQFILNGAMPEYMLFGYKWFNTGHVHQLSLSDFKKLVERTGGLRIKKIATVPDRNIFKMKLIDTLPNIFMLLPVVLLEKTDV
jgi:methionine biosynthesis protein MetW